MLAVFSNAFKIIDDNKIPVSLEQTPEPLIGIVDFRWDIPPCIVPLPPWGWYEFDWSNLTTSILLYAPACGISYHENGKISSDIACEDDKWHGKAIYWDETGHKYSECTYHYNHLIKQKSYDSRGRAVYVKHYNLNQQLHGIHIEHF